MMPTRRGSRGASVSIARLLLAGLLATAPVLAGCGATTPPKNELRFKTDDFVIRISPETRPTRALESTYWRVVVNDKKTGTPIQGGQGRIFATNRDRKTVANGLEETGELGTYRTNLMFVTAGMWAMSMQFRRDSTKALQRTEDWTQDILAAEEPGNFETPQSSRPAEPPPTRAAPPAPKKEP
jgi:hypothetical protein